MKHFYVYLQETMSNLLRAGPVSKSGEKKFGLEKFARVTKKYGSDGYNGGSFGLDISRIPTLATILEKDDSLADSVTGLMKKVKSEGTVKNYENEAKKFEGFCEKMGYMYQSFDETAVLHYILDLNRKNVGYGQICQVKPSLRVVEQLRGVKETAFTEMVDVFLNAARRRAAEVRPPVKKAGLLPVDILKQMYQKVMANFDEKDKKSVNAVDLRTLVRCTVVYFTFCRFSCFQQLQARDIEDRGDSMRIMFRSAKNDQMHNGSENFLMANEVLDPVKLLRVYFNWCGFSFGEQNGDESFLNPVILKGKGNTWRANGKKRASYSQSTAMLRRLVAELGHSAVKVTDKSFKMLGVTRTLEDGVTLDEVMNHGRWRTLSIPLHYKVNSEQYKKDVAAKVPV